VQDFIAHSPNPVVVLQNPKQYGFPYRDLKYGYWINPAFDDTDPPDQLLAGDEPVNVWSNLYWRSLVHRNPQQGYTEDNFLISLEAANSMMDSSNVDTAKIDQLIRRAQLSAADRDNLDQSWLFHTKGKFLQGVGQLSIATDMFEEAIRLHRVSHNPAIPALIENYLNECREEELDRLMTEYRLPTSKQYQQARSKCSTR
jgi:hypothetical protein